MSEKRRQPRRVATDIINIYDANEGVQLGRLVNVTSQGMMLVSSEPIGPHTVYQIDMVFTEPSGDNDRLCFGAEALWCTKANTVGHYWTGFQIIDITDETADQLDSLTSGWDTDRATGVH